MTHQQLTATLLAMGLYERAAAPFRLLEIAGPEAAGFLQRLCSQDIEGLTEGEIQPAAFLDAKGKVLATVLAFRRGDSVWLETQADQATRLHELLERYHFSEKLTIACPDLGPVHEVVLVGGSAEFVGSCKWVDDKASLPTLQVERRGLAFSRCHGGVVPFEGEAGELTQELAEAARMLAGFVRVGVETEASTLALEADLDDHCSTRKGCYTGQEIVARIHTYGKVNRNLCLLQLGAGDAIKEPATLVETEDEIPVGRVMWAMPVARHELRLGLGYLPKDFQEPGTKLALEDGGGVEVVGFGA